MLRKIVVSFFFIAPLVTFGQVADSTAKDESASALLDRNREIEVDGKVYTYEDALPILTKKLDGNLQQKWEAAGALSWYGDSLIGTEALKKLIEIVKAEEDFHALRRKYEAAFAHPDKVDIFNLTAQETAQSDLAKMKGTALSAAVMAGAPEAIELMNEFLKSPDIIKRLIPENAKLYHDSGGVWKRGRKPTKGALGGTH
jgi:hypothetical protein